MSTNLFDNSGYALSDSEKDIVLAKGTTVPADAATDFVTGALFLHTDGSNGTALYVNEGTTSSAAFKPVASVVTKNVELTSAEVKALRATPKEIIAAPGAGKMIVVESVALQLNYGGTNAFTETADNLVLEYSDSGTDITASIETTGFIDQTADTVALVYPATIAAAASATAVTNESVVLKNTGDGEIAGNAAGNNTLLVSVAYRVVTLV